MSEVDGNAGLRRMMVAQERKTADRDGEKRAEDRRTGRLAKRMRQDRDRKGEQWGHGT
jgi:hypothetical protein